MAEEEKKAETSEPKAADKPASKKPADSEASKKVDAAAKEATSKEPESAYEVPDAPEIEHTDKYTLPLKEADKRGPAMKGMRRTVLIAVLAIAIAVLGVVLVWVTHEDPVKESETSQEQPAPSRLGAAATFIEGVAEMHSGDENWTEIDSSVTLTEGDTVRTGSSSRLVITIDDGSAVRLNSNSEATLQTLNSADVTVVNNSGEVYTRVVSSDSRGFNVLIGEDTYTALGTAYKTSNTPEIKGVDVYHSQVRSGGNVMSEGEAYFTQHTDNSKENTISKINLDALDKDEFLKWNAELDKNETDFADKLGILEGIDKDDDSDSKPVDPDPSPGTPGSSISASAKATDSGVKVTWSVSGVNTDDGFKVVYSKSSSSPTYGIDASHYVGGSDARSAFVELTDGKTYTIRVCAYRPSSSSCTDYSNAVTVTAPTVQLDPVLPGEVSASISGDTMSWSLSGGNAPYGYKVIYNTTGSPVYPNDNPSYTGDTSKDLSKLGLSSGTYKFRVCKYTNNTQAEGCVDYSNEVEYVVP